jgi:hypothetical protein
VTWQFVIAGLFVGLLVGMTGMGGGSLMTPMLILIFGFNPKTAVGTDILHGAIFKSFGAWRHRQLGNVHTKLALWMLVGSGPMSLLGVRIASSFSGATGRMSQIVGLSLILGGIGFFVKTFFPRKPIEEDDYFAITTRVKIMIGAVFGFVVGLTSVGSGTFFGLALLLLFPLSATRMVGTDLLHASLLLWIAGTSHLLHGNVDMHAMAWLLVGSIPGVLTGSHISIHVPDRILRVAFAVVLLLSGVKLVKLPAADQIVEVGAALGIAAFLVWITRSMRSRPAAPAID